MQENKLTKLHKYAPIRFNCSVKIVSPTQTKEASQDKIQGNELAVSKTTTKPSKKKMKFVSYVEKVSESTTAFVEVPTRLGQGISTMPHIVKRKIQKIKVGD